MAKEEKEKKNSDAADIGFCRKWQSQVKAKAAVVVVVYSVLGCSVGGAG